MADILPRYYQIKAIIKKWIVEKEFNVGDRIPSENELAARFDVSRLTVRQAVSQLVQEGFLTLFRLSKNSPAGERTSWQSTCTT